MEERGETHAAGISHFGAIMESHYQSESCPGRPNEAPAWRGSGPLHAETTGWEEGASGGGELLGLTKRARRRRIKSISRRRCVRVPNKCEERKGEQTNGKEGTEGRGEWKQI